MPLTDVSVRQAKPGDKPRKLADERGLYLLITLGGSKLWRLDYRFDGKRKTLALGAYPDVSLKDARERRDEARRLIAAGSDPALKRKLEKLNRMTIAANAFELVAREWFERASASWTHSHGDRIIRRLERDVFPWLGARPISEITPPELLTVIRRIEKRGALETAHRAMQNAGQVFRYAVATGRAERDPTADLRGALPPVREKHFAALVDPKDVACLLRAIDGFSGTHIVKSALKLAPQLFVRPGELRNAEWGEFDVDSAMWSIPAARMKTRRDHLVPLSRQVIEIIEDLRPLTVHCQYLFPGVRDRKHPMSNATINAALRRMGYDTSTEMTGHGFRAMARTILHEQLDIDPHVIEHQLAHKVSDPLGGAYNRTKFLAQRKAMMQIWSDYLDELKRSADVIQFPAGAG